ncbi:MAG: aminotransferase class I/II-fold pyridoxal phosphate-dependent enzyme [Bacteroidota bacterium]
MSKFSQLSKEELQSFLDQNRKRFHEIRALNLDLNMTRGKPSPEQLDLSLDMLDTVTKADFRSAEGVDGRNYGGLDGLAESKELFATVMGVSTDEIIIGGNASLTLMHDTMVNAYLHGVTNSKRPWGQERKVKFICPVPGYDRHFNICAHLGIEMIPVEMGTDGPDVGAISELVAKDDAIKGMWMVPMYSNPTGHVYSDEVIRKLASLPAKAQDFRIFCDNAYAVHHLTDAPASQLNMLSACKDAGFPDRVFLYGSTSKVTFAGAGVSVMCGSVPNMSWMRKHLFNQTIGPDKLNQLRHVRFFQNLEGIQAHMKKHAAILKPKFDTVLEVLERELGEYGIAEWTEPKGGYFISLNTPEGCAKRVVDLATEAGVKLTAAGATFPYKKDPKDQNIRLAPSLPALNEIKQAMEVVALCIKVVSAEKQLES